MEKAQELMQWLYDMAIGYGLKLIGALVVLVIGLWIIKTITKGVKKSFNKRGMDESLKPFLISLINALLKIMLGIRGINTTRPIDD